MLYNRGEHVRHCSPYGPLMLAALAGHFILLVLADASIESLALLLSPLAGAPGGKYMAHHSCVPIRKAHHRKGSISFSWLPPQGEGNDGARLDVQIAVILQ